MDRRHQGGKMKKLILLIFLSNILNAQYILLKSTFSGFGGSANSDSFLLKFAGAQSITGESKDTGYIEQAGFYTYETIKIVAIKEKPDDIKRFFMSMPYPNPTKGRLTIRYGLAKTSKVEIKMYDITGRLIKNLVNENQKAGCYILNLDLKKLPSGIYFVVMRTEKFNAIRKFVLINY